MEDPRYIILGFDDGGETFIDLKREVEVDDCIEVYFVWRFVPSDLFGGGATTSGGAASANIVTSDELARIGGEETHLAHELGHVLGLRHRGDPPDDWESARQTEASPGTLMCPSGFANDSPRVNSQWNEDHVHNPLLRFSLQWVGPEPDCDDEDCGVCPPL